MLCARDRSYLEAGQGRPIHNVSLNFFFFVSSEARKKRKRERQVESSYGGGGGGGGGGPSTRQVVNKANFGHLVFSCWRTERPGAWMVLCEESS